MAVVVAAVVASLAWFAVGLQYWLLVGPAADRFAVAITFFSYFTVLTNLLVAVLLTAWLRLSPRGRTRLVAAQSATAVYITIVGLVYTIVLRRLWNPTGFQALADTLLHDVVPALYVVYWLAFVEKGTLRLSMIGRWLAYPLLFLAYSLARGALTSWYPYPFFDASHLGYVRVLLNAAGLVSLFVALAAVLVAADRILATRRRRRVRFSIAPLSGCARATPSR
jgi:hypothetical protein